jgi:toxin ParE1/3/4
MSYSLTPQAQADIEDIAVHIAMDDLSAAHHWLNDMERRFQLLGDMPGLGVARPDIRADLRILSAGNYLILYRQKQRNVEVVRVLHGARQWQALL